MSFLKKRNDRVVALKQEVTQGSKFVKFSMNIPRGVHEQFRRKSFLEGKDMKDVLMEAIAEYLD